MSRPLLFNKVIITLVSPQFVTISGGGGGNFNASKIKYFCLPLPYSEAFFGLHIFLNASTFPHHNPLFYTFVIH